MTDMKVAPTDPLADGASRSHPHRPWRWSIAGLVWLVFLLPAVHDVLRSDRSLVLRGLTLLAFAAFVGIYVLAVPLYGVRPGRELARYAVPFVALGLGLLTLPVAGEEGLSTFVYVAVLAVVMLPPALALGVAGLVAALAAGLVLGVPGWSRDPVNLLFAIVLATVASSAFVRLSRRNAELAVAREDLADFAVEQERVRFARDLHDLLGHSLTVITVKSELAGRLLARDPERAAAEVADIERLAREALADVRATVAGYREVTLALEVSAARSALDAAGIQAHLPSALDEVPGERRELFGWVVREGVTNAVRHSRAQQVRVQVSPTTVEVVDDGAGCAAMVSEGHGLTGLRERLSSVGGHLEAGPLAGGGYRLFAQVPR